jgi:hypothetical protein
MNPQHNNNDDSEDDMIMYKEQSVVPWSHHDKSQPTQQQLSQHHTEQEMNDISIVPRQERKRRRQEWRERLLADQQPSDNDDSESDGPLENTFASLQSLLKDEGTPPEDKNDDSQLETTAPQHQEEVEIVVEENYGYTAQQPPQLESEPSKRQGESQSLSSRRMMESEEPPASSPPDFVVYEDDDDPDDEQNQTTLSAVHDPPRTVPGNRSSTKSNHLDNDKDLDTTLLDREVKRQRRRSKKLQEIRISANSTSVSEPNLDLNRSPTLKKSNRRRKPPSLREITQTQTTNASQPTPVLHNSKSIVGSRYVCDYTRRVDGKPILFIYGCLHCCYLFCVFRPTHWARNHRSIPAARPRIQRLANSEALAAATRAPWSRPRPRASPYRTQALTEQTPADGSFRTTSTSDSPVLRSPQPTTNISFAPSFCTSKVGKNNQVSDQIEEVAMDVDVDNGTVPIRAPASTTFSSKPARRRKMTKASVGPLGKRLTVLRNSLASDSARISAFGISQNAFDLNDPRRRAKSHTDVTILGVAPISEGGKLTILGLVHTHVRKDAPPPDTLTTAWEPRYGWISFTPVTARSINLQKGLQLRMYNAVLLPCPEIQLQGLPCENSVAANPTCRHILLCTQLCEPFAASGQV